MNDTEINKLKSELVCKDEKCHKAVKYNFGSDPQFKDEHIPKKLYVVLHEMMHALGGSHEQQRGGRTEDLSVDYNNIQNSVANNYFTYFPQVSEVPSAPFSLASTLMYSRFIFNKISDQGTMKIKNKDLEFLTEIIKRDLSFYDRLSLTSVFQCGRDCGDTVCNNGGFATVTVNNPSCACVCPEHLGGISCDELTGSATCSRTINLGQSGTDVIESPNYPANYNTNEKCVYLIKCVDLSDKEGELALKLCGQCVDLSDKERELALKLCGQCVDLSDKERELALKLCGQCVDLSDKEGELALKLCGQCVDLSDKEGELVLKLCDQCVDLSDKEGELVLKLCDQCVDLSDKEGELALKLCGQCVDLSDKEGELVLKLCDQCVDLSDKEGELVLKLCDQCVDLSDKEGELALKLFGQCVDLSDKEGELVLKLCDQCVDLSDKEGELALKLCDQCVDLSDKDGELALKLCDQCVDLSDKEGELALKLCDQFEGADVGSRIRFNLQIVDIPERGDGCAHSLQIRSNLIGERGPSYCGSNMNKEILSGAHPESHLATVIWDTNSNPAEDASTGFSLTVTAIVSGCLNRPCKNGGTCDEDENVTGGFICTCPPGIGGNNCGEAIGTVSCNEDIDVDIHGQCFLSNLQDRGARFSDRIVMNLENDPPAPQNGITFYSVVPVFNSDPDRTAVLKTDVTFQDDVPLCVRFKTDVNNDAGSASQLSLQVSDNANTERRTLLTISNTGNVWESIEHEIPSSASSVNRMVYFSGTYGSGLGVHLDDISIFPGKCNLCSPNPCENGGSCTQTGNVRQCQCVTGFDGDTCGEIVQCLADTCLNGGTCHNNGGVLSCDCVTGFTGQTCQFIDRCVPNNPCNNNGLCSQSEDTYTCTCANGFWGTNCDDNDICLTANNCENGATCIQTGSTTKFCNCNDGFYGTLCEITDICSTQPCQNGGNCNVGTNSKFYCSCPTNFIEDLCSVDGVGCSFEIDQTCPFTSVPFDNFDWEVSTEGGPSTMQHGEVYMFASNDGRNNGDMAWLYTTTGMPTTGEYCVTFYFAMYKAPGLFGVYSTTPSDDRLSSRWIVSGENFTEFRLSKTNIPSGHTKVAFVISLTGAVDTGAYVALDNIKIYSGSCDACKPNPCDNGGTCAEVNGGAFCTCASGYMGPTCSENTPVCESNPCQNGGTCSGSADSFTCACADGFSGLLCEQGQIGIIFQCNSAPCQNGGTCNAAGSSFSCSCDTGFTGSTCETNIQCNSAPCQNGGTCNPAGSSFSCSCDTGFTGSTCETNSKTQKL
ncbi:fibropellin-1-like [Ylistrum balloti]|uniref:fibropellin-1-like n=1 Tax=Ylistrum balloti TaxID=509963 RepID=UPI002905DC1D|nr:fibropellin-1-like [Ylistrum balloti]